MKQGQSSKTLNKQVGFRDALGIAMAGVGSRTYYHLDCHAGSGVNDACKCSGSPKVFIEAAQECGIEDYHAFFCDNDYNAMKSLIRRPWLRDNERCYPVYGDNSEAVKLLARFICNRESPRTAVGSIIYDPNGWLNDIENLRDFTAEFPNIAIIANGNVRTRLLIQSHIERGKPQWRNKFNPDIEQLPRLLNRQHWLVRDINYGSGGQGWAMMVGSSKPVERQCDFHYLHSPDGQRILNKTRLMTVSRKAKVA